MNKIHQINQKNSAVFYLHDRLLAKSSHLNKNCDTMLRSLLFSFIDGTSINAEVGNDFILHSSNLHLDLKQLSPGLLAAIWLLCAEEVTEEELYKLVRKTDRTDTSVFRLTCYIQEFIELGLICHTVGTDESSLATLIPISTPYQFHFSQVVSDKNYVLSCFAERYKDNGLLALKSSLFPGKVILKDCRSEVMVNELVKPQNIHSLSKLTDISIEKVQLFLSLLLSAKLLSEFSEE